MVQRSFSAKWSGRLRTVGLLVALSFLITACQARGGGHLPPGLSDIGDIRFQGDASFGFSLECRTVNGKPQVRGQLSYHDHGPSLNDTTRLPYFGEVKLHGEGVLVSPLPPQTTCASIASMNSFPTAAQFEGRYRAQASNGKLLGSEGIFKVLVFDQGEPGSSSLGFTGDGFSIELIGGSYPAYSRAGYLDGGNVQVDE